MPDAEAWPAAIITTTSPVEDKQVKRARADMPGDNRLRRLCEDASTLIIWRSR